MNADICGHTLTAQIAEAVLTSGCAVIAYRSEWNGLDAVMPMDHWLESDGQRIDLSKLGSEWGDEDLARLEERGALFRLRQWTDPDDKFESARWYLTNVIPRDPSGEAVALLQAAHALLSNPANALAGSRWGSSSDCESEIARTIDALRTGCNVQLATWADPNGDFVRVGTASGWEASAQMIAERIRLAATAIVAKMPPLPTLAPMGGASERALPTVGEPLQGGIKQSAASARRDMWIVRLFLVDLVLHLVLFAALAGLPPNPINSLVQDWLLERSNPRGGFGTIDTDTIIWGSFVGVLVLFFGQLGAVLLVHWGVRLFRGKDGIEAAPPPAPYPRDSGHTGQELTERNMGGASAGGNDASVATEGAGRAWGHYERRAALAVAVVTPVVAGMLLLTDSVDSASASSAATVATFSPLRAPLASLARHVNLRVTERRDLVSAVREHTSFYGRAVNIRTTFSGVRTDFTAPLPDDEVIVPLSPVDTGNAHALELFWHASRSSDPSLYPHAGDGAVSNAEVLLAGTLHRRALPRFVVNSYRRAGVDVADDYFVLEPELSDFDRKSRRVIVLVVGWGIAALLLAWPFFSDPKLRQKKEGAAPKQSRSGRRSSRIVP